MTDHAMTPGVVTKLETLSNGTVRLKVDLDFASEDDRLAALQAFGAASCPVIISRMTLEAAQLAAQKQTAAAYGQEAKTLRLSGFFRAPEVWPHVGSDDEFKAWVQRQKSVVSGDYSEWVNGEGRCIAHHVRRADESGVGHKADYVYVPLTAAEHHQLHYSAESSLKSPEWFDAARIDTVQSWCWETLKRTLDYDHWSEVPPHVLGDWARERDLYRYLPRVYRVE